MLPGKVDRIRRGRSRARMLDSNLAPKSLPNPPALKDAPERLWRSQIAGLTGLCEELRKECTRLVTELADIQKQKAEWSTEREQVLAEPARVTQGLAASQVQAKASTAPMAGPSAVELETLMSAAAADIVSHTRHEEGDPALMLITYGVGGLLDEISMKHGEICCEGWVTTNLPDQRTPVVMLLDNTGIIGIGFSSIDRDDVIQVYGGTNAKVGFCIPLPQEPLGPLRGMVLREASSGTSPFISHCLGYSATWNRER